MPLPEVLDVLAYAKQRYPNGTDALTGLALAAETNNVSGEWICSLSFGARLH